MTSCMDSNQKLILNPDGSGKAQVHIQVQPNPMGGAAFGIGGADAPKPDPEKEARETAGGLLAGAEGVDAWKNVEWGVTDKGLIEFKAIAYFSDINEFEVGSIKTGGMSMSGGVPGWEMTKNDDGTIVLGFDPMGSGDEDMPDGLADPDLKPSAEEIDQMIKQERMQFQQMKPMMGPMLAGLKTAVTIKVPGEIQSKAIFEQAGPNVASMSFSGKQMLDGMEKVMMNDELMKKMAEAGQVGHGPGGGEPPEEAFELIFGEPGPVQLTFKPGAAQFDYAAEVKAAQDSLPAEIKEMIEAANEDDGFEILGGGGDGPMKALGDGDLAAAAKVWKENMKPKLTTDSGREITAEILELGNAELDEDDNESGYVDAKVKFTHKDESETMTLNVSFGKSSSGWRANGFSGGGMPDFMGEGIEGVRAVGAWVRGE